MRRRAPRPLAAVLPATLERSEPVTLLARVQASWRSVAGPALTASAMPVAEREGVVTVACDSAAWAQELELLAPDLVGRLNERLDVVELGRVERLRFVVGSVPNPR
jgi:predicted nucleic acid-binding Zn ribbon protein